MTERNRIVFFHIGSDVFGGGSQMLLRLLRSINRDRFEPVILSNSNDELCQRVRKTGIKVEICPFRGVLDTYNRQLLSEPYKLIPAGGRILQFNIKARSLLGSADVVWCKNLRAILTLLPFISVSQTPIIWNIGLGLESEGKTAYLNSIALRAADYVFIESEEQARRMFTEHQLERHNEQFTIFHKGINSDEFDPARFSRSQHDGFRIGTAASLTPRKGIKYLIDAIPSILERIDNVTLVVAGEAPEGMDEYRKRLQKRIYRHGIEDHVELLGWVENMPKLLNSLDVFVLPSLNEGIPGSVREALAMEVPVVATDVGGTANLIEDGENGLLIDPEDSEEIREAVLTLLQNHRMRCMMGKRGRKTIKEDFSIESYIKRYEEFLNKALSS